MTKPNVLLKSSELDRRAAIEAAARMLLSFGIGLGRDEAWREARLLLEHCLSLSPGELRASERTPMAAADTARLDSLIERRRQREPVSQILGQWEFWSLPFFVTPDTLTPRPDSEALIHAALSLTFDRAAPLRILDLGTGTGCLLLSLLHELPAAHGLGIDKSQAALAIAERNAQALGLAARVHFAEGDWTAGLIGSFDLVLCNPPYIPTAEIAGLMPEVSRHEPALALDGGLDGLDAYRALAPQLAARLAPDGHVCLEAGAGQAPAIAAILESAGLMPAGVRADLGGRERCVIAKKTKE
jgi:release factor glutamine methyltransferase